MKEGHQIDTPTLKSVIDNVFQSTPTNGCEYRYYNNDVISSSHCKSTVAMIIYKLHIINNYNFMTWLPEFIKELRLLPTHKFYCLMLVLTIIVAILGLLMYGK